MRWTHPNKPKKSDGFWKGGEAVYTFVVTIPILVLVGALLAVAVWFAVKAGRGNDDRAGSTGTER